MERAILSAIHPILPVRDASASIDFYVERPQRLRRIK